MKGKGSWIIPFVLGIMLQMFINYIGDSNKTYCNTDTYEKQIDSIVNVNLNLVDSIEVLINNIPINTIKDTIIITKYHAKKVENLHILSSDSLIKLALEGTEKL